MVAPVLLGSCLDSFLGTRVLFAVAGGALGMTLAVRSLIRLAAPRQPPERKAP